MGHKQIKDKDWASSNVLALREFVKSNVVQNTEEREAGKMAQWLKAVATLPKGHGFDS